MPIWTDKYIRLHRFWSKRQETTESAGAEAVVAIPATRANQAATCKGRAWIMYSLGSKKPCGACNPPTLPDQLLVIRPSAVLYQLVQPCDPCSSLHLLLQLPVE